MSLTNEQIYRVAKWVYPTSRVSNQLSFFQGGIDVVVHRESGKSFVFNPRGGSPQERDVRRAYFAEMNTSVSTCASLSNLLNACWEDVVSKIPEDK